MRMRKRGRVRENESVGELGECKKNRAPLSKLALLPLFSVSLRSLSPSSLSRSLFLRMKTTTTRTTMTITPIMMMTTIMTMITAGSKAIDLFNEQSDSDVSLRTRACASMPLSTLVSFSAGAKLHVCLSVFIYVCRSVSVSCVRRMHASISLQRSVWSSACISSGGVFIKQIISCTLSVGVCVCVRIYARACMWCICVRVYVHLCVCVCTCNCIPARVPSSYNFLQKKNLALRKRTEMERRERE